MRRWRKRYALVGWIARTIRTDQVATRQVGQSAREPRPLAFRQQFGERTDRERSPDHGRALEEPALDAHEMIEPSRQKSRDRRRDREVSRSPVGERAPVRAGLVRDIGDELLDEQGVALGGSEHSGAQRAGRQLRRELVQQRRRVGIGQGVEAGQEQVRPSKPARMGLFELRAGDGDEEHRASPEIEDVLEEFQQRRLGPLDVVDEQDERALNRQCLEEPPHGPGDLLAGRRIVGEADCRGNPATNDVALVQPSDSRPESGHGRVPGLVRLDAERGQNEIPDGPVRDPVTVR